VLPCSAAACRYTADNVSELLISLKYYPRIADTHPPREDDYTCLSSFDGDFWPAPNMSAHAALCAKHPECEPVVGAYFAEQCSCRYDQPCLDGTNTVGKKMGCRHNPQEPFGAALDFEGRSTTDINPALECVKSCLAVTCEGMEACPKSTMGLMTSLLMDEAGTIQTLLSYSLCEMYDCLTGSNRVWKAALGFLANQFDPGEEIMLHQFQNHEPDAHAFYPNLEDCSLACIDGPGETTAAPTTTGPPTTTTTTNSTAAVGTDSSPPSPPPPSPHSPPAQPPPVVVQPGEPALSSAYPTRGPRLWQ